MTTAYMPFRPALDGPFASRFLENVRYLSLEGARADDLIAVAAAEVDWALTGISVNPRQRRLYRAVWLLLRDPVRVGWSYRWQEGVLEVAPPPDDDVVRGSEAARQAKDYVRRAMETARKERSDDSTVTTTTPTTATSSRAIGQSSSPNAPSISWASRLSVSLRFLTTRTQYEP